MRSRSFVADPTPARHLAGTRHRSFTVARGRDVVGRATAFVNPRLRDDEGRPVGGVGFFECVNEYPCAESLLACAVDWLRREGEAPTIWGPVDLDLWGAYRFKCRGFEGRPFLGEPDNPPWYPAFFERFGFAVRKTWCSMELSGPAVLEGLIAPGARPHARALRDGYRLRPLGTGNDELRDLHDLLIRSYRAFLGFTPIAYRDFDGTFGTLLRRIDRRFVTLARDPQGRAAGFAVAYPEAVGAAPGRVVFHSLGVPRDGSVESRGLGRALVFHTVRAALDAGHERVLAALVAEDSPVHRIVGPARERAEREYALYELQS